MLWVFFLEIASKEQSSSFMIKQFTKGTEFFKERLGLAFKKVDGKLCCSHPRFIVRGFFIVYQLRYSPYCSQYIPYHNNGKIDFFRNQSIQSTPDNSNLQGK